MGAARVAVLQMGADALTSCVAFNFCIRQRARLLEIGRSTSADCIILLMNRLKHCLSQSWFV